jgi:Cu-Zn family superoxide dismutase
VKIQALILSIPCVLLLACGRTEPPPTSPESTPPPPPPAAATPAATTAEVTLTGAPAKTGAAGPSIAGTLQLTAAGTGVQITGTITGLPPKSEHGFHVHETGDCAAPDFKSAGGHFNPEGKEHGNPASDAKHLGDIANITADETGTALVNATIAGATLKDSGPHDLAGKALIVHAKRDDYKTQPAGDSGDRVACGVIH